MADALPMKEIWDWTVGNIQSWPSIPPVNLIAFVLAMTMLSPLVIKGLRALRSDEPPAPPPAAPTPLPPFFSVEVPWITQHLVTIDANLQMLLQLLRDERGRNRLIDIMDRQDALTRKLETVERMARARSTKK